MKGSTTANPQGSATAESTNDVEPKPLGRSQSDKATSQLFAPVPVLSKIGSYLPLAIVLCVSESCVGFLNAMRDDDLWLAQLERDFVHYEPDPSSGSWQEQYKQQVCAV